MNEIWCGANVSSRTGTSDLRNRGGAALAVTLVLALVLAVLAGALFALFSSNASSYRFTHHRIRAQFAAESGASLALHALALEDSAPEPDEPYSMEGDSAQWIELPGSGDHVWVVIDPFTGNDQAYSIGGVEIRCRGLSADRTRDISVRAVPDYPSRYALLVDEGISGSFLTDGRIIDGPLHANGIVEFSSYTADSTDDVFVRYASTGWEDGFRFSDAGMSSEPHPRGSRIWVRPYMSHLQGLPSWNPVGHVFDFGELATWFYSLHSAASAEGVLLGNVERIVIDGTLLLSRKDFQSPTDTIDLTQHDLVYVSNGSFPVYVKTSGLVERPLTLVATGSIYIAGDLAGSSAYSGGPLALVTLGDLVIAEPSGASGIWDWPRPWNIDTDRSIMVRAVLAAPSGTLRAQDPDFPDDGKRFSVTGSLILESMNGNLGYPGSGYELSVTWDSGLASIHPPRFPSLEYWSVTAWELEPDYGNGEIDDNLF